MPRKIKHKQSKTVDAAPVVKENSTSLTGLFKNYPRIIGMFVLLLFLPPLGWIFAYKYSPYDRKTSLAIAAVCTSFFVYAVFISPEHSWIDNTKLTRADFCTRYNEQATKLAPRLGLTIDEDNLSIDGENFSYELTDTLKLSAQIQNEFVKEVTVTATPKNTDDSFQALNCFGLIAATLNPELDSEKRGDLFRELEMLDKTADDNLNTSTTKGNVTYLIRSNSGKFIFTAKINGEQ